MEKDGCIPFLDLSIKRGEDGFITKPYRKPTYSGRPFSPAISDLYMGFWEKDLTDLATNSGVQVHFLCRYADDMLAAIEGTDTEIEKWVRAAINSKSPEIKVTLEMEKDGCIPFLDLSIKRGEDGFITKPYRKPTYSGQVVAPSSFTQPRYRTAGIRSDTL